MFRRHEGGSYRMPTMAPLPGTRVTETIALTRAGLDYLGPMIIKTSERYMKVCAGAVNQFNPSSKPFY